MKNSVIRIISVLIAAAVFAGCICLAGAESITGDVNGDGKVFAEDALIILQYSVGLGNKSYPDKEQMDMNGDGEVNSADALAVLQICVGIITPDPSTEDSSENSTEPSSEPSTEPSSEPSTEPSSEQTEGPVLPADKEEIVTYYNNALKKAYASDKVTINKKTNVTIEITDWSAKSMKSIINNIIQNFGKPTEETESFTNGVSKKNVKAEEFLVPAKLESDGAASVSFEKTADGYKSVIVLVPEVVDSKTPPKYNAQSSIPLTNLDEIAASVKATLKNVRLSYAGTIITAYYDEDGNIISLNHTMPLAIEGSGKVILIGDFSGAGEGVYTLDAKFSY